jgi:soluble lytic murein transglycosylase
MQGFKKPQFFAILLGSFVLIALFQNMSLVEFSALNIPRLNEEQRRLQARELLGADYFGSFAQKVEGQEYLNYLVLQKLTRSLGPRWESRVPNLTRILISDSQAYHFDPVFLLAVMQTESGFNTNAVGTSGEIGLMQIRPETAEWIAGKYGIKWQGPKSLYEPSVNIRIGIRYFAYLRETFANRADKYVTAYNMGVKQTRRLGRNIASVEVADTDIFLVKPKYAAKVLMNYGKIYRQMIIQQRDFSRLAYERNDGPVFTSPVSKR